MTYDGRPWAQHFQDTWGERAGSPNLPLWLRVAALAYGKHGANGHATFGAGEVRLALSKADGHGVVVEPSQDVVRRAIRVAVEYGWLGPESRTRCLVVPGYAIKGGLGNEYSACVEHGKRRRRQALRAA